MLQCLKKENGKIILTCCSGQLLSIDPSDINACTNHHNLIAVLVYTKNLQHSFVKSLLIIIIEIQWKNYFNLLFRSIALNCPFRHRCMYKPSQFDCSAGLY